MAPKTAHKKRRQEALPAKARASKKARVNAEDSDSSGDDTDMVAVSDIATKSRQQREELSEHVRLTQGAHGRPTVLQFAREINARERAAQKTRRNEDEEDDYDDDDEEEEEEEDDDDDEMQGEIASDDDSDDDDDDDDDESVEVPAPVKLKQRGPVLFKSQANRPKSAPQTNRQRTLVFSGRHIHSTHRHFMNDLRRLLPHSKREGKFADKKSFDTIASICRDKNCQNSIFLQTPSRKKRNTLYMWISKTSEEGGPTVKFQVHNVHTMASLKLTGNCLRGSRPLLHFDAAFSSTPELSLIRELLIQTFGTPRGHPKSMPFIDHVLAFFIVDNRIWFRNYQIVERFQGKTPTERSLVEIGPRFILTPLQILASPSPSSSINPPSLIWETSLVSVLPVSDRQSKAHRFIERRLAREARRIREEGELRPHEDAIEKVFSA